MTTIRRIYPLSQAALLDSIFRWNDNEETRRIPATYDFHVDAGDRAASGTKAEVVERRWEQAAEVVPIPRLWRGARQGGVVM